jgi:hypothetical protein
MAMSPRVKLEPTSSLNVKVTVMGAVIGLAVVPLRATVGGVVSGVAAGAAGFEDFPPQPTCSRGRTVVRSPAARSILRIRSVVMCSPSVGSAQVRTEDRTLVRWFTAQVLKQAWGSKDVE